MSMKAIFFGNKIKPLRCSNQMQQPSPDEEFQLDKVLDEVEMELIWLGEESAYSFSCPECQFDFIYE